MRLPHLKAPHAQLHKLALGLLTFGLLADIASAQAPTPKRGGTAIVAIGGEPSGINPTITTANPEKITGCIVYEGLVTLNMTNDNAEPLLAESWTISPDGKTYTFKLRKASWHDGVPFTSEDVRYTLMEVAAKFSPTFAAQAGKLVEAVDTPDAQTAVIKLKEPYGPLLRLLTCPFGVAMLPSHLFKGSDVLKSPVTQKPVGTGPFKFSEWVRGTHTAFTRNDKYWDEGKPYLDGVVVRFLPSGGSRTQALLAGEVDLIPRAYFPPADGKTVETNPNTKRELTGYSATQLFAFFNMKRKPLDDVRVRQALLIATDRKYLFEHAFFGVGRPGSAPWSKEIVWASDPSIDYDRSHPFDPEKAGQMLEAAGYKADANGVRFKLSITYDAATSERGHTATALQAMWKRAGIEVTTMPLEGAVLLPRVHQEANFDVYLVSNQSWGDPALGLARQFGTIGIGATLGNAASYSNPEVDDLFDRAGKLMALEERGKLYRQIQPMLLRDMPAMMLYENRGFDAASKKLQGAWGWAGNGVWANAWLDK